MKKCASCSKDLPEAALHCVFCGAKQAPAPAVQPSGVAKTAFGYSANEVMAQLGQQQQTRSNPGSQPPPSRGNPGSQPPPVAAATAATMFDPGAVTAPARPYAPPQPAYAPPASAPFTPPAQGFGAAAPGYPPAPAPAPYAPPGPSGGMGIHSPQQSTPAPLPRVKAPYAPTGAAPTLRPIEPWRDSLRLMMFVWGAVALAAFAVPVSTDPMAFNWDAILHESGTAKVPALVWAAAGLLSIVFAAIPMPAFARGALAAVLGLAGIFAPLAVTAFPEWQLLLPLVGSLALVSGLLIRNEYKDSLTARVLVTIGVITWLVPYLIPQGGQIPLVGVIKMLLDGANHMEIVIIVLAQIVLAVLCLLAWMPGPQTAGAKIFAWIVLLFPVAQFLLMRLADGHIADVASKQPALLVAWAPGLVYSVLVGYGLATVIGKQLE